MDAEPVREPCNCFFLHEAATNPHSPIEFDPELNEFHIKNRNGYSMVYYCPSCGGKTPESLRDDLFARISEEEDTRLKELTSGINSVDEMIAALGTPDKERRSFTYKNISESAHVMGMVENGEWKGMYFTRKQVKLLPPRTTRQE